MSSILIAIVGFIYLGTTVSLWLENDKGMAIAFFGYALANVGFIIKIKGWL